MPRYAELQVISNFSFLEGASHAEELVATAAALGHAALGIADRNTLAGVVRSRGSSLRMTCSITRRKTDSAGPAGLHMRIY